MVCACNFCVHTPVAVDAAATVAEDDDDDDDDVDVDDDVDDVDIPRGRIIIVDFFSV